MKMRSIGVFLVCSIGIVGTGLFALPTAAAYFTGTFYWGPILGAGALAIVAAWLFGGVYDGHFCTSCTDILPHGGKVLAWGYILFYTAVAAFLQTYFIATVQNWFLGGVPRLFLALFLHALCLYTAFKPTKTIVRLLAFLSAFLLITVLVMRLILLFSGDLRNLFPLLEGFSVPRFGQAVGFISAFFVLLGFVGLCKLPCRAKQLSAVFGVCVGIAVFILACAGCISVLGVHQTSRHLEAAVLAMKNLDLSKTDFLQRGDMVFIVTWCFLVPAVGALAAHIPVQSFCELYPHVKRSRVFVGLYVLFCATSLLVRSQEDALLRFVYTASVGGGVVLFGFPIVLRSAQRRKKR